VGGAVWSLLPPDADTRRQLLQFKALRSPLGPLPNEVADFLAQQLRCNVRELEGALHSVAHYRRVTERPLDVGLVREALAELLRHSVRLIQLPEIDQAVCRALRLPNGTLQSKDRSWCHAQPRMLAMYLARKHTTASYTEVGRFFGGRTHSTAVAAEKKVRQWLQDDTAVAVGENRLRVRDLLDRIEAALLR
jgi:chromosomal replication initiator protein